MVGIVLGSVAAVNSVVAGVAAACVLLLSVCGMGATVADRSMHQEGPLCCFGCLAEAAAAAADTAANHK